MSIMINEIFIDNFRPGEIECIFNLKADVTVTCSESNIAYHIFSCPFTAILYLANIPEISVIIKSVNDLFLIIIQFIITCRTST